MGDKALDQEFIQKQRTRLEEMKAELLQMNEGLEEDERERSEDEQDYTEHDVGDMSQSLFTREMDNTVSRQLESRLRDIERALEKIEEGTYGICDETGEPIPKERLEAVPEAIYTIEAQRRLEG